MLLVVPLITAHAFDIVRDGQPAATIIVSQEQLPASDAPPSPAPAKGKLKSKPSRKDTRETDTALALRTLREWLKKITDAEIPRAASAPASAPAIYLGDAAIKAGLKLDDIDSPSREGIRIVIDDKENRILIAGQSEGATLKAVCRFLEHLGCRYFMDGPLGEVYPRQRTLTVAPVTITEKPALIGRNPKGPSWDARLWKAWNGGGGENLQHSHAWGRYVSPDLFAQHPEFFAMGADGQRKAGGWLCTSNPKLREHFANGVIAAIESGTKHPSLSPTDGRGYCQCPACKAQDDPNSIEPSSGTVAVTNRYVDFFDDIARRVAVKHPDSVLSFYVYADYTQPPTVRRKLSPNLCAVIAPIRYCRLHEIGHPGCPSRLQQVKMIEEWTQDASRLGYYNYMYNLADATLPFFKFTACRKEFPWLYEKGLSFMTLEMLSNWHIYGPQMYLSLRLAYDPTADATAIMDDYWEKFYGPKAAPHMKAYWMGIDQAQDRLNTHAGSFFGLSQIYTPEFVNRCQRHLEVALAATNGDPVYTPRVTLHGLGFRSAVDYRGISDGMNRGDFAEAPRICDQLAARLRGLAEQGHANREYATAYLERFLGKIIDAGAEATASPNRLLQVLPDEWRFTFDESDKGLASKFHESAIDDTSWPVIRTRDITLDAQGFDKNTVHWFRTRFQVPGKHGSLALFFGEIDGATEVFVNGTKIAVPPNPADKKPPEREGQAKPRTPFEVDITAAARPGENTVALRVDHTKITDLSLGGILRPVLLIEKAK
jgi:hypothetical protein